MTATAILKANAALRTAYGVAALFAPDAIARVAGIPPPEDDARYLNALFGGRDLTVAWVTLKLLAAGNERGALTVATSCEATDLAAWLQEALRRGGMDRIVATGAAFNLVGVLTCVGAAKSL